MELKAVVMKKKRSGKKGSRNAGAERFPQTEALNHEHEKLKEWFRTVRFRKVLFGGVDENGDLYDEVWRGVITRLTFEPIP